MKPTDKIGKYLTYADVTLCPAEYAKENKPTPDELKLITEWVIDIYDPIADHFGIPPFLHSMFRCQAYNDSIPGSSKLSSHRLGLAGDLDYDTLEKRPENRGKKFPQNWEIFKFVVENLKFDQIIWEKGDVKNPGWLHISNNRKAQRGKKTRYNGKTKKYIPFDLKLG